MMPRLTILITLFAFLVFACASNPTGKKKERTPVDSTFSFKAISPKEVAYYNEEIKPLYSKYLLTKGFNGSILVAKNGEIVFEDYHGLINFQTKDSITPNTPFHLASISKTFTGMVILRLMEQGKLKLDDNIQKYFPAFPYQGITIKNLLTHRSGLPNYIHLMDERGISEVIKIKNKRGKIVRVRRTVKTIASKQGCINNEDVLQFLIDKKPPVSSRPDQAYNYCNTNFVLLALIVEKITNMPFPKYMKDSVFTPLGMTHSFIFNINEKEKYLPSYKNSRVAYGIEKLDCVYGDKNVYSTVRDMFQWDKALYEGTFVSLKTLNMAFQPYSNERRSTHNYGLAWHLLVYPNETVVYHNGWWHGNNTVFTRLIKDTATLIVLGNRFNKSIYGSKQITTVFTHSIDTAKMEE